MSDLFLTDDEVKELTGYSYASHQIRWLQEQGIRHFVAKNGHPRVVRQAIVGEDRPRPRRRWKGPDLSWMEHFGERKK